ncbi:MAG: hypothetical protein GC162_06470 [Planctomycetes bacterium]|nr:hypothetical protein [Planctomycetota bacterium]
MVDAHTLAGCAVSAIALDFNTKVERPITLSEAAGAPFAWIDIRIDDVEAAAPVLAASSFVGPEVAERVVLGRAFTEYARYESSLHLALAGCTILDDEVRMQRVDVIVTEKSIVTVHRGTVHFIETLRRDYHTDFVQHAQTGSFLLYELWDHLLESYSAAQLKLEEQVQRVQAELMHRVDDSVFEHVSRLGANLVNFRTMLVPAQAALNELSTRRTTLISPATQTALANMIGHVERLMADALADREILSETLNLRMSIVAHHTNEVVKRLTVVSIIFLPLTFLCGLWGMNFKFMPEIEWRYGYLAAWLVILGIVTAQVIVLRRKKLL